VPATAARREPLPSVFKSELVMPVTAKLVVVACVKRARGKVEVAVVVAVKWEATVSPTTESFAYGVVVPMPTEPVV